MKSFVDYGHKYILYAYEALEVPAGVELHDASQIAPKSSVFYYGAKAGVGRGSIAAFSNVFRYRLLHEFGEWWVDTDVLCRSEKPPEADIFLGWEDEKVVGSAILKFPKRHTFIEQAIKAAEKGGSDLEWGETGPTLITTLMKQSDLGENVVSPNLSYPIPSADALQLLLPSFCDQVRQKTENAPMLHIWNEVLRRAVVFKWIAPPAGSFMSELFARHDVQFPSGYSYSPDDMQRLSDNYSAFTHWSWHEPRIDAQGSRLTEVEYEFELLRNLYAAAIARIDRARGVAKAGSEIVETNFDLNNAEVTSPSPMLLPCRFAVVDYGPESSFADEPFNMQPSGRSGIWVRTSRAPPPLTFISFDGARLETVISDTLLTAEVPQVLLMRPRKIGIELKSDDGQRLAQPVEFVVVPRQVI